MHLQMVFETDQHITGGYWEIKYMVDMAAQRQIIEVCSSN